MIDQEMLDQISKNARIEIVNKEKTIAELNEILEMFDKIAQVDTRNIKPMRHPVEIRTTLREDEGENFELNVETNSSHFKNKYFVGPKLK